MWQQVINSLVPGRSGSNFKSTIFKLFMQHSGLDAQCEVTIRWIPPEPHSWEVKIGCHHMASLGHNELISDFLDVHRDYWWNDKIQTEIQALSHLANTLEKNDSYICWKVGELYWEWYIDGLVQDCSNSSALLQSCTNPSIYILPSWYLVSPS